MRKIVRKKKKKKKKKKLIALMTTHKRVQKALGIDVSKEDPLVLFDLQSKLGRGSYGSVYRANCQREGLTTDGADVVAVKVIALDDANVLDDVRKEVSILEQCDHPNIVSYYGSYYKEDSLYLAMAYCGGGSISDLMKLRDAPLDETHIAFICLGVVRALAYLHSLQKIHRDIKGASMLLLCTHLMDLFW
jgi:serine/threonine protein kinase